MEFEKEFDVSIPDEQAEGIQTVGQAISYLEQNVNAWFLKGWFSTHPLLQKAVQSSDALNRFCLLPF